MRTIIDVPEATLEDLNRLGRRQHTSRASLIRQAMREFLDKHREEEADRAFGIWRDRPLDALSHQQALREEWNR